MQRTINWPENHRAAVMISVELDSEYFWLSLDPTNIHRPKTRSMGTYGMKRGFGRILATLKSYDIPATFFVPGIVAEEYPKAIEQIVAEGHEIAVHGYRHENFGLLSSDDQKEAIDRSRKVFENLLGYVPSGFRLPEGEMTPETMDLLINSGFQYDSSLCDADLPYIYCSGESKKDIVEIPMRWEMQDTPYFGFNFYPPFPAGCARPANFSDTLHVWLDNLEAYTQYGLCYVLKIDPQMMGFPGRILLLEKFLEVLKEKDAWISTGKQIAEFTRKSV